MKLEWKESQGIEAGWFAQTDKHFYRIQQAGKRTFLLRVDAVFIERYSNEVSAKEHAERIENDE